MAQSGVLDWVPNFNLNLYKIDYLGLNTALNYKIRVEESLLKKDSYTRFDSYSIRPGANSQEILKALPIFAGVTGGLELTVARQFPGSEKEFVGLNVPQLKALWKSPFIDPRHLPVTAKNAVEHFKTGDFVSFRTFLNVFAGASVAKRFGIVAIGASTNYLLSGDFQVHLFKVDRNRVRLKLIGLNDKSLSASIGGRIDHHFRILAFENISDKIEKPVEKGLRKALGLDDLKFLGITAAKGKGHVLVLDYLFDLSDSVARDAYNSFFDLKNLTLSGQLLAVKDALDLKSKLLSVAGIAEIDAIAEQDAEKSIESARIRQLFRGVNNVRHASIGYRIGLNLLRVTGTTSDAEHRLEAELDYGKPQYFLYNSGTIQNERRLLWNIRRDTDISTAGLLVEANNHMEPVRFGEFSVNRSIKLKSMNRNIYDSFWSHFVRVSPKEFFSSIDFKGWKQWRAGEYDREDVKINYQIVFEREAFEKRYDYTEGKIREELEAFIGNFENRMRDHDLNPALGIPRIFSLAEHRRDKEQLLQMGAYSLVFKEEMDLVAKKVSEILTGQRQVCQGLEVDKVKGRSNEMNEKPACENIKISSNERREILVSLLYDPFFVEIGTGFFAHLAKESAKHIHVDIKMSSKHPNDLVEWQTPREAKRDLYNNLRLIENTLNNRSYDMRTELTSDEGI